MTKKHFEAVAEVIQNLLKAQLDVNTLTITAEDLAEAFEDLNPRFNRARFLAACGTHDDE